MKFSGKKENAINFLLYSYFELTLDSDSEEIIRAAIHRAYRDASSRVLSIAEEAKPMKDTDAPGAQDKNSDKEELRDAAAQYLKGRIAAELSPADYLGWHHDTCEYLVKKVYKDARTKDGKAAFRFGHAQKWVNMTMKYLYVIKEIFSAYGVVEPAIFKKLTPELEQALHVPVDSYIMEAASLGETVMVGGEEKPFGSGIDGSKNGLGLNMELPQKGKESLGGFNTAKSWSTWDEKDYEKFRKEFLSKKPDGFDPLDWEGLAWIEIAKIRKEREENRKKEKSDN